VLGFAAELVLLPTGLITAAVLTRTLGPTGYGLFSVAATFITWLAFTTTTLLARAAVKFVSEADDWRAVATGVLRWRLVVGSAAFVAVLLGAPLIARLLGAPELAPYLRVFAIDLLLFNLARAYRDVLTGRGRFREVAAVSLARWMTRLALIVLLVRVTGSIMGAVVGSVGATAVELLVARWFERVPVRGRSPIGWSRMWRVAAPLRRVRRRHAALLQDRSLRAVGAAGHERRRRTLRRGAESRRASRSVRPLARPVAARDARAAAPRRRGRRCEAGRARRDARVVRARAVRGARRRHGR
jgi:hypothetical protein